MSRSFIDVVFVPQGPELKAVQRGLSRAGAQVKLIAVSMGPQAIQGSLEQWLQDDFQSFDSPPAVLLMGLCGSLSPDLSVGDWVLYQSCTDVSSAEFVPPLACDAAVLLTLQERLQNSVATVTSAMSDQMIHRAADKLALAHRCQAAVVDMEGYAFLKTLESVGVPAGMLRVVSDDSVHDLPDLSAAMTATGTLDPLKLGLSMATQPISALRLIQGSLKGLKQLELAAICLFAE
jgi:nucleoside phosphorylase